MPTARFLGPHLVQTELSKTAPVTLAAVGFGKTKRSSSTSPARARGRYVGRSGRRRCGVTRRLSVLACAAHAPVFAALTRPAPPWAKPELSLRFIIFTCRSLRRPCVSRRQQLNKAGPIALNVAQALGARRASFGWRPGGIVWHHVSSSGGLPHGASSEQKASARQACALSPSHASRGRPCAGLIDAR